MTRSLYPMLMSQQRTSLTSQNLVSTQSRLMTSFNFVKLEVSSKPVQKTTKETKEQQGPQSRNTPQQDEANERPQTLFDRISKEQKEQLLNKTAKETKTKEEKSVKKDTTGSESQPPLKNLSIYEKAVFLLQQRIIDAKKDQTHKARSLQRLDILVESRGILEDFHIPKKMFDMSRSFPSFIKLDGFITHVHSEKELIGKDLSPERQQSLKYALTLLVLTETLYNPTAENQEKCRVLFTDLQEYLMSPSACTDIAFLRVVALIIQHSYTVDQPTKLSLARQTIKLIHQNLSRFPMDDLAHLTYASVNKIHVLTQGSNGKDLNSFLQDLKHHIMESISTNAIKEDACAVYTNLILSFTQTQQGDETFYGHMIDKLLDAIDYKFLANPSLRKDQVFDARTNQQLLKGLARQKIKNQRLWSYLVSSFAGQLQAGQVSATNLIDTTQKLHMLNMRSPQLFQLIASYFIKLDKDPNAFSKVKSQNMLRFFRNILQNQSEETAKTEPIQMLQSYSIPQYINQNIESFDQQDVKNALNLLKLQQQTSNEEIKTLLENKAKQFEQRDNKE